MRFVNRWFATSETLFVVHLASLGNNDDPQSSPEEFISLGLKSCRDIPTRGNVSSIRLLLRYFFIKTQRSQRTRQAGPLRYHQMISGAQGSQSCFDRNLSCVADLLVCQPQQWLGSTPQSLWLGSVVQTGSGFASFCVGI